MKANLFCLNLEDVCYYYLFLDYSIGDLMGNICFKHLKISNFYEVNKRG